MLGNHGVGKGMIQVFESDRLICRPCVASDIDTIFAIYSDEKVSRWVDDGKPITYEKCQESLSVTEQNYISRGYGMFALDEKASNQTIVFCGLVHPSGQIVAEIKYALLRSCWGKGYASEAVPQLIQYGVSKHQLDLIIAKVGVSAMSHAPSPPDDSSRNIRNADAPTSHPIDPLVAVKSHSHSRERVGWRKTQPHQLHLQASVASNFDRRPLPAQYHPESELR